MNTRVFLIPLAGLSALLGACATKTVAGPTLPPAPVATTGPKPSGPSAKPTPTPAPTPDPYAPMPIPQKPPSSLSPLNHGADQPLYQRE